MGMINQTGYFRPANSQEAVGVSRSTLYRWRKEGLIQARKVRGMSFFAIEDVKRIIESVGGHLGDPEDPYKKSMDESKD